MTSKQYFIRGIFLCLLAVIVIPILQFISSALYPWNLLCIVFSFGVGSIGGIFIMIGFQERADENFYAAYLKRLREFTNYD